MNLTEYQHLQAERTFLTRQLAEMPADAVLTRKSDEARLRSVESRLAETKAPSPAPARARLTFRGRPVVGHHGVFAEFGTKATSCFADAVNKIAAALGGPLSATGPIPNRDQCQLLITNTAVGSFGFELEEHCPSRPLCDEASPATQALELTRSLLESTLGSDDELADSVSATDPRAVEAVRTFVEVLATNEAVCSLECGGRAFRFGDVGAVRKSLQRLSRDNLHGVEATLHGEFEGVLPASRTFEFRLSESGGIIRGKVGPAIVEPDSLNSHLHQPTTIIVNEMRVGSGKPRYVLTTLPTWNGA